MKFFHYYLFEGFDSLFMRLFKVTITRTEIARLKFKAALIEHSTSHVINSHEDVVLKLDKY